MNTVTITIEGESRHCEYYTIDDLDIIEFPELSFHKKAKNFYANISCAFDIETSTILLDRNDKIDRPTGFMYHWQFCLNDIVIFGRRWEEYQHLLDYLQFKYKLHSNRRLVIFAHWLEFEFQFSRNFIEVEEVFARSDREVMYVRFNKAFEYRCSYKLSNMPLSKFIKNTPNAWYRKQSGDDYDYRKLRTPSTPLSNEELSYCYCDVRGLCEAINHLLEEDTIASLPLTSTGFIRREVREAVLTNPSNHEIVKATKLTPRQYVLCKTASRGGNSHANAYFTGEIIHDGKSRDRKSSYPAEMIVANFPVGAFQQLSPTLDTVNRELHYEAMLLDVTFYNVSLKNPCTIPYISFAKCTQVRCSTKDNGRIVTCTECSMVITDVDYCIITDQYHIADIEIREIWASPYGHLNNEFRTKLMDMFYEKTVLEIGDQYLYNKFKNKINAYFGMMLTDICSPEIIYNPEKSYPWEHGEIDLEYMLNKYYNNRRSFLSYQHGTWVTANARYRHQQAILACGDDILYGDTDSVKFIGDHDKDIEEINKEWLALCDKNDIAPYVHVRGKNSYLGVWENDGEYDSFVTLGAKKYAYIEKGGKDKHVHITVAGLSKDKGADYLEHNGGIEAFKIGTVVPAGSSGRTTAYYNDESLPYTITIDSESFLTASNIGVLDASYTFGVSGDYYEYFLNCQEDLGQINFKEDYNYERNHEVDEELD